MTAINIGPQNKKQQSTIEELTEARDRFEKELASINAKYTAEKSQREALDASLNEAKASLRAQNRSNEDLKSQNEKLEAELKTKNDEVLHVPSIAPSTDDV